MLLVMKISLNWLQDFVEFTVDDPQEIAARITACTAEVEEVEQQGAILHHCCVGKVLSVSKHPDADKLSLCDVQTDKGKKRVVCGGTNLREGMRIAFAHIGAKVYSADGSLFELSKVSIRGEESNGMICAAEELDLTDSHPPTPEQGKKPIIDFGDGDEGVGLSLREYLNMDDTVLHIDNHAITHRADLFSHIGFARECVAIGIAKWKKRPTNAKISFGKTAPPFEFKVDQKELMPRYCACMISIDGLGETPNWMKQRLLSVGWRPLNLPIDITNYVATEIGVPLHSFDADDIKGTVHMRTSQKGEKIVTLDKQERTLPDGALVLSDDEGIFDLLGIMGGLRSSTKASTSKIYLHSASLDPASIRHTVIATGHRTDAATVYEKGVPHIITEMGFYRAVELILELVPGAKVTSKMESVGDNGHTKHISLSCERTNSVLGTSLAPKDMSKILVGLDFGVKEKKDQLDVEVPLHRLGDVSGEHDLVEEVGRVFGYDEIDNTLPMADITPPKRDRRLGTFRCALKEDGYVELLPLSLLGPKLVKRSGFDPSSCAQIENPIGEEVSLLMPSTLPALLEHAEREIPNVSDALATFHIGHIFDSKGDLHNECGMLISAKRETDLSTDPFLLAKSHLQHALARAGYSITIKPSESPAAYAHPARCVDVHVDGKAVGTLFEVHPMVRSNFDLPARAAACLLNMDAVFATKASTVVASSFAQFPAVTYDVTITLDHAKKAQDIVEKISKLSDLLEKVEVADIYSGKPLKDGQYNLTLRCVYRATDRTLKEEEVKQEHDKILRLTNS